ncbi:MAG: D-aminoacyl-tRNA deacylase [Nitrososphaeria archaeon]
MRVIFIASNKDPASLNIAENVIEKFQLYEKYISTEFKVFERKNFKLVYVDIETIFLDRLNMQYDADLLIVLAKHTSSEGISSLTAHPTGNLLNEAKYGGEAQHIAYTNPWYMTEYFLNLFNVLRENGDNPRVSLEVTHHGPTEIEIPLFFVEIGSDIKRWTDKRLGEKIAEALYITLTKDEVTKKDAFVGFGGGHYAPAFSYYIKKEDIAIGHMVPKYALDYINQEHLFELFKKSLLNKPRALIDKKGIPSKKLNELISFFDKYSIEFLKI